MTALIIGVGPGLGLALVKKFFERGMNIIMVARNKEKLDGFAKEFSTVGQSVSTYSADVGNNTEFGNVLDKISRENGVPDVVIYNVSILRPASPSSIDYHAFESDFGINIGGALTVYQKIIPQMSATGKGTYLITGGGLSLSPFHEFASLGVGKAGLRNLVFSFAQESASSGVHVYTITINGMIEEGTYYDPSKIADKFFDVFENGLPEGETELIYQSSSD